MSNKWNLDNVKNFMNSIGHFTSEQPTVGLNAESQIQILVNLKL